ncbi:hypothetical protein GEMRC1_009708 [Eukaryota sp. GEM-RC1]
MLRPKSTRLSSHNVAGTVSLSSISSSNLRSKKSSTSYSTIDSASNRLHFQQSLLILIHLHFLRRFLTRGESHRLKKDLFTFFAKVGYVSHHFFESALLAIKVFLQTNTFHVEPEDLPQLCSFASFFGAEIQSVFVHINGIFKAEEFLCFSHVISGLEFKLRNHNDLEFLNKSSLFFPRLKELHVDACASITMLLMESLKVNTSVTSINLVDNSMGAEGAKALGEMLKVNTTVKCVNLERNFIGAEGTCAIVEALTLNSTVNSINMSINFIRDEGTTVLVEALKANNTIANINLSYNAIGNKGARAFADALKVNATLTSVNLGFNSIGDPGARALADALMINTTISRINLEGNSIGAQGAIALAKALTINTTLISVNVKNNSINADGTRVLTKALKIN